MLYNIFDLLVNTLKSINLVEYWKTLYWLVYNKKLIVIDYDENLCRTVKGKAIDYFIIMKYGMLFLIFNEFIPSNDFTLLIIWYMLLMNIFTYFYYHLWENKKINRESSKKRFINFILSIVYSSLSFMLLYKNYYTNDFEFENKGTSDTIKAFSLSFGTFFNSNNFSPTTDRGYIIFTINCIINFIFLTFILANTNISHEEDN